MIVREQLTFDLVVNSLRSTTCPACGQPKKRLQTLCRTDYYTLPVPLRAALYARVGGGYEEALLDAFRVLETDMFHQPPATK
jgi:hypothetical protein